MLTFFCGGCAHRDLHNLYISFVNSATEKILAKARQMVDVRKDDGFAALHLAALNGHVDVAATLIDAVSNVGRRFYRTLSCCLLF